MAIERHGWRGRRRSMTVDDNTSCRHTTGHRRHMIADDAKRHVETLSKENILWDGDKAQLPSRRHSMRQAHRQTYENALLDKGEAAGLIVATSRRADVIKTHGIKQSQSLEWFGDQAVNTSFILSIQQNQNPPLTVLGTGSQEALVSRTFAILFFKTN